MSNPSLTVHLRVYRGKTLSYDANGNVTTENQIVKLPHDTQEWTNFLAHLRPNGYIEVRVEKVLVEGERDAKTKLPAYTDAEKEVFASVASEVKASFALPEAKLTPEQQKIADLEARLDALTAPKEDKQPPADDALTAAREAYVAHFEKKGHHTWDADTLYAKINEDKNSTK